MDVPHRLFGQQKEVVWSFNVIPNPKAFQEPPTKRKSVQRLYPSLLSGREQSNSNVEIGGTKQRKPTQLSLSLAHEKFWICDDGETVSVAKI